MNWPERYKLVGDSLIANIALAENTNSGLFVLERDPRKQKRKPDCYVGEVTEVGSQCKLIKPGDRIVFVRWMYSQSDVDQERICLREVDLVVVNEKCVNGFIAVQLYEPFKKDLGLVMVEERKEVPRNYWGKIVDIDRNSKNKESKNLKENDIILFQRMDDYQYRVGQHVLIFKDLYDVVVAKMETSVVPLEVVNV